MTIIKKIAFILTATTLVAGQAFAADALHGTKWKTVDDKTGKPKALVEFTKQANGTYIGTIVQSLDPANKNGCAVCTGKYKGKPLAGLVIVHDLRATSDREFKDGKILDPKNDRTYSFKATLTPDGQLLKGRGYFVSSLAGRDQTWYRVR